MTTIDDLKVLITTQTTNQAKSNAAIQSSIDSLCLDSKNNFTEISGKFTTINTQLVKFEADFKSLSTSLTVVHQDIVVLNKDVKALQKADQDLLAKVNFLLNENAQLKLRMAEGDKLTDRNESKLKECNAEIGNIPNNCTLDETQIAIAIAKHHGLEISEDDIFVAHRIQPANKSRMHSNSFAIVVRFYSRKTMLLFESKAYLHRKSNTLQSLNFNYKGSPQVDLAKTRYYVNHQLSIYRKNLLRDTKIARGQYGWAFVWSRFCKIYLRKVENGNVIVVNDRALLDKLIYQEKTAQKSRGPDTGLRDTPPLLNAANQVLLKSLLSPLPTNQLLRVFLELLLLLNQDLNIWTLLPVNMMRFQLEMKMKMMMCDFLNYWLKWLGRPNLFLKGK